MKGKKLLFSKLLFHTQLLGGINLLSGNRLVIFNYHRIKDDVGSVQAVFDDEVFGPSASQFYQQMLWLKKNTEVLSEGDVMQRLHEGRAFSRPSTLITFDDSYIDNYRLAYPVLRELQIPAIFFIPTHQITSRQLGWWDTIAYLLKSTKEKSIVFDNVAVPLHDLCVAKHFFYNKMKREPSNTTSDLLDKLSTACNVALPPIDLQRNELMTWDQLREVAQGGITVGSHSVTHRVLATLPIDEQLQELTLSKLKIEQEVGVKVHSIAYPVGNYDCFTEKTMQLAAESGYTLGFSFHTGINSGQDINPYNLKRIWPADGLEHFAVSTMLPKFFSY